MLKLVDMCCGCAAPGYHCLGEACSCRNVPVHICDKCLCEIDEDVYDVDGEELCEDCLKDMFRR